MAALARYCVLPLNAFGRVHLFNIGIMSQWMHRTLFLSKESMFRTINTRCLEFVLIAEGMEWNSDNVNKSHNVPHVPAPLHKGRLALQLMLWSHHARFVTMMQSIVHTKHSSLVNNVNHVLPSHATTTHHYLSILTQLGARTTLHIALPERLAGGLELIDSKNSDDGAMLQGRTPQV